MDKMSYDEAVAQLGAIVSRMEDPNVGITEVKDLIKKANELIAFCKNELKGYEQEINLLLEEK